MELLFGEKVGKGLFVGNSILSVSHIADIQPIHREGADRPYIVQINMVGGQIVKIESTEETYKANADMLRNLVIGAKQQYKLTVTTFNKVLYNKSQLYQAESKDSMIDITHIIGLYNETCSSTLFVYELRYIDFKPTTVIHAIDYYSMDLSNTHVLRTWYSLFDIMSVTGQTMLVDDIIRSESCFIGTLTPVDAPMDTTIDTSMDVMANID